MKFYKNNILISKKYLDDCVIRRSDQKLIIIFTDYESSFFASNKKKYELLMVKAFYSLNKIS